MVRRPRAEDGGDPLVVVVEGAGTALGPGPAANGAVTASCQVQVAGEHDGDPLVVVVDGEVVPVEDRLSARTAMPARRAGVTAPVSGGAAVAD